MVARVSIDILDNIFIPRIQIDKIRDEQHRSDLKKVSIPAKIPNRDQVKIAEKREIQEKCIKHWQALRVGIRATGHF